MSQSLALKAEAAFDQTVNCNTSGTWRFTASAVDAAGLSSQVVVEAIVPASAGQVLTPTASPPGFVGNYSTKTVTLAGATSGSGIEYQIVGLSAPAAAWSGTPNYSSAVTVGHNKTLYARATNSPVTVSAVAAGDYE